MAVKIITDSPADIPLEEAKKLGIHAVVPIHVNIGGTDYLDGATITPREFFAQINTSDRLAITSQASPAEFYEYFNEAIADGSEVVAVLLSRFLSGMVQSATIAKEMLAEEGKGGERIHIVDSETYTLAQASLVFRGLALRDEGLSASEIKDRLDTIKCNSRFYTVIDDLKYLRMGGRIWGPGAAVGDFLQVKPVVGCKDGKVGVAHAAMGLNRAYDKLIKDFNKCEIDYSMPFCISHAGGLHMIENFKKYVTGKIDITKFSTIIEYDVGVSVGTHSGPNCVGLAYFVK